MTENYTKETTFNGLGISTEILERLTNLNFTHPTPIQYKSIPIGINGEDLIGIAQTGTGKTLSFSIPLVQRLSDKNNVGLVLLPTRELALQVADTIQKIATVYGLTKTVLIGGASMMEQIKSLRSKPNIIVATPGRLIDHIERKNVNLAKVKIIVLDEADRMLDMGFEPQIKRILNQVPAEKQTLLYCATLPHSISKIAEKYMKTPLHIEVAPSGTTSERIEQEIFIIHKEDKIRLLSKLLDEYKGTILIFTRTKRGAKKISDGINKMNHSSIDIHSDKSQSQRKAALSSFKSGKIRILVATDVASRGIDVENIELVINYDLPDQTEDYVHRIGRTGRAGKSGKAISFATPEQKHDIKIIEKLIRNKINVSPVPELPDRSTLPKMIHSRESENEFRGGRSSRNNNTSNRFGKNRNNFQRGRSRDKFKSDKEGSFSKKLFSDNSFKEPEKEPKSFSDFGQDSNFIRKKKRSFSANKRSDNFSSGNSDTGNKSYSSEYKKSSNFRNKRNSSFSYKKRENKFNSGGSETGDKNSSSFKNKFGGFKPRSFKKRDNKFSSGSSETGNQNSSSFKNKFGNFRPAKKFIKRKRFLALIK
ncbi:MAG: DEAD/DEAH box helicase [Bacteroidetes bacterium]|nr:DEAD/DEAH box helicase [Bacteroidota bacterium]